MNKLHIIKTKPGDIYNYSTVSAKDEWNIIKRRSQLGTTICKRDIRHFLPY